MNQRHVDTIVLGGGTMGSAVAWALAKQGQRILVLEQFAHVHDLGSHGGQTRILRHAYAESPAYVPLVQQADRLWRELEQESGTTIFTRCGGLEMAASGHAHARNARRSADDHGLPYEWITPAEGRKRWPMVDIPDGWDVFFDPQAGFVMTDIALQSMMRGAVQRGAMLRQNEPVLAWGAAASDAWVTTPTDTYRASSLVITPGAWASSVLSDLALPLQVVRKTLWWLDVDEPSVFGPDRFPVFVADSSLGEIYGFPVIDQLGLKIADHAGGEVTTVDTVDRSAVDAESDNVRALAQQLFSGVRNRIRHRAVCLYTRTPDTHFIIDRHPVHRNVIVACGFSGHGFKFAPAVGELAASLLADQTHATLPLLSFDRLGPAERH